LTYGPGSSGPTTSLKSADPLTKATQDHCHQTTEIGDDVIHHIGVFASDFEASRAFYAAALLPLGVTPGYETEDTSEFWQPGSDTPSLSLERAADQATRGLHVAFAAPDHDAVDAFFRAASRSTSSTASP
jgi:hypothetical protein